MKIDKIKHDHSLTKLLKVLIFAIVMLIPAFSVASRCLYVICNKNAYQSYSGNFTETKKYETNEVETANDLKEGNIYSITFDQAPTGTSLINIGTFYATYNVSYMNNGVNVDCTNNKTDYIIIRYNDSRIYFSDSGLNIITNFQWETVSFPYTFDVVYRTNNDLFNNDLTINSTDFNIITYTGNINTTMDNVFTYSLEKLGQDEYLTWTQNTAIYTGINTMNTQLGITMPTYSMVLTYWFFMIVIYVIIDIVLGIFTALTHMLGKKIE